MKDFNDEIQKITNQDGKKPRKPIFMLPPGGTPMEHNENVTSAAHLLEKYRVCPMNRIFVIIIKFPGFNSWCD